ncbi:hypothetical protein [Legionella santicrucis]|uniref:hypothetical protein n=1 Tax=Legionella santicrucis TaxID=45074 RepID=UPI0010561C2A|nr:hypothetical protein [Legionella santicrucis]
MYFSTLISFAGYHSSGSSLFSLSFSCNQNRARYLREANYYLSKTRPIASNSGKIERRQQEIMQLWGSSMALLSTTLATATDLNVFRTAVLITVNPILDAIILTLKNYLEEDSANKYKSAEEIKFETKSQLSLEHFNSMKTKVNSLGFFSVETASSFAKQMQEDVTVLNQKMSNI